MEKEITVIEFDPDEDTILILRKNEVEFRYPGMNKSAEFVDPRIIPMVALAMLYGFSSGDKLGIEEQALSEILFAYVEHNIVSRT